MGGQVPREGEMCPSTDKPKKENRGRDVALTQYQAQPFAISVMGFV